MNGKQKLVQQQFLNNEEGVIKRLTQVYTQASKDINQNIADLMARSDANSSSVVYQVEYQKAIQKQIDGILDTMNAKQFTTVSDYLQVCYEDGFVGTMFDLQGQGVPFVLPMNQEQIVRAVQLDSKINGGMYASFGEDTKMLKKHITAQISRGISTGMSYEQVAQQISLKMMGTKYKPGGAYAHALNIARTEGHRIQCQSGFDALYKARDKGADITKQWDSTLDGVTRPSHRQVDGEIRELDEEFSNGLLFPGDPDGAAEEVCNCRCALLQRARWALKEKIDPDTGVLEWEDGHFTKWDSDEARIVDFSSISDYNTFKQKYLNACNVMNNMKNGTVLKAPIVSSEQHYNELLTNVTKWGVEYKPVETHTSELSEEEIIQTLSGGDQTSGSCASVGLAYIGQKQGYDILDFRGGDSQSFFSRGMHLHTLSEADGIKALHYGDVAGKSSCTLANNFLKTCEPGKEYYLCVGRHAAIVRKTPEGQLQYLELQSATRSGWTNFNGNPRYTLTHRFGCSSASGHGEMRDFMIDIDESDFSTDEFKSLLGYLNTADSEQKKGVYGSIK